jgi:hypothetical protein
LFEAALLPSITGDVETLLLVELVLLVLLLVVSWLAEASREAFADLDELASREELDDFEADADKDPCDALLSVAEADREASADLVELAVVDSEADLLEVASSEESWLAVALVERLSVFAWLRVRLESWVLDVSRDVSRLLLLDALFVTSEEVESVAEILAPRE